MSALPVLNSDQEKAFKAIQKFLEHPSADTFVLKGYAGTGKTFLMQYLGKWLEEKEMKFCMLATTGRAASVLKGKTGFATKTVHGEIYSFSKMEGAEGLSDGNSGATNNNGQLSMQFLLRMPDEDNKLLYIIDEASMLSGDISEDNLFATFGSAVVLDDLFKVAGKNKIIFVGDPCQLPPVKQSISPALDTKWLAKKDRIAVSFTLTKIERTDASNDILKLAGQIRKMNDDRLEIKFPKLPASNLNNVKLYASDEELFQAYSERQKVKGTNRTLAIARSNKTVQNINKDMRRDLFGSAAMPLQIGDVLLVTQNNYRVPLSNGDFVIVCSLGDIQTKERLNFQTARVKAVASDAEYDVLLSVEALKSDKGNLNDDQLKSLIINFTHRMQAKNISANSQEYRKKMMEDEYFNCLRTTYGYAVTCHKAQGGEWDDVFLFLDKSMYGMEKQELFKWWYTAITRSRQELNMVKAWWIS
jgi:ATP-dependent exoDNAse (exonuclease V) alpha subunit